MRNIAKQQLLVKEGIEDFSEAWNYVDRNSDKFVNELIRLVSQPSISTQHIWMKECVELVRSMMENLGIRTELIPVPGAPDIIHGELRSSDKNARTLVIYNHYDVQPIEPLSEWRTDPFKPQVTDGKIFGRGTGDDKGEIVARISAIRTLLDTGNSIKPNIKWIIQGDEETHESHFNEFVLKNRSLVKGDGCLWEGGDRCPKGTPEIHLGTKGLVYVEFRSKVSEKDELSSYGPIAPNPAWRLVNLLNTIRDESGRILIDGFYDDAKGPTPLEKKFLKNSEFNLEQLKSDLKIDHLTEGKSELETLTNLLYSPTANIAGFGAGYLGEGAKAIIPHEAFVKIDFRIVPGMKAKDILAKIKKHLKSKGFEDVALLVYSIEDPSKTPLESHIAQTMIQCVELVNGREPNVWPTCPGTGIPSIFTDELKLDTAMGLGVCYPGSCLHAPNENIRVEDYKQAIKQLVCLFRLF